MELVFARPIIRLPTLRQDPGFGAEFGLILRQKGTDRMTENECRVGVVDRGKSPFAPGSSLFPRPCPNIS